MPMDVYTGRAKEVPAKRAEITKRALQTRRLQIMQAQVVQAQQSWVGKVSPSKSRCLSQLF